MKRPLTYRPEREVQKSICDLLTMLRIPHSVTDASRAFTPDGQVRVKVRRYWPDVTAVLPGGRAFFIECKTVTGKASAGQLAMLEELRKQGAVAIIARSAGEVYEIVKRLSRNKTVVDGMTHRRTG